MKYFFLVIIVLASLIKTEAQDTSLTKKHIIDICSHSDESLYYYQWEEIENAFAKRVNIPVFKCEDFFVFAFSNGYLSMKEYRDLVKIGTITPENAKEYWLAKLPYCEEVYKKEYQTSSTQKNNTGHNSIMTSCNNLDFSTGTTANWVGQWNNQGSSGTINGNQGYGNLTVNGFNSAGNNSMTYVHEICTAGNDPNVPVSRVPPGHTYSLRLGSDSAYRENNAHPTSITGLPFFHQKVSNTFLVTPSNKIISYWYAVCLTQNESNPHPQYMQPYFKIRMYDGNGNEIMCAHYDVDATTASSIGGFNSVINSVTVNGSYYSTELLYKDWSQISIPLLNYVGQNVTITFETSDCAGGGHSGIAYVAVDCLPLSDIAVIDNPCNATKTLVAPPGMASYFWSGTGTIIGPTNQQSVTVTTAGTYSVAITTIGNSGFVCNLDLNKTVTAPNPLPTAAFTNNIVCSGNPTQFSDVSTTNGDTISSWNWNFGDGSTSTLFNPSHTYVNGGTYNVSYTIITNHNCQFTDTATIIVNQSPTALFTNNTPCVGNATIFTNTSTNGNTYQWDFGDGTTSTLQSPQHIYTTLGTYTVELTVTSSNGCTANVTHNVTVKPVPSLMLGPSVIVCSGATVSTPSYTITPNSPAVTYSWTNDNTDIGLGVGAFGMVPSFVAASNTTASNYVGNISITPLLNGCPGTPQNISITVKPTPIVSHTNINLCPSQSSGNIIFTASPSIVPSGNITWINTNPSVQIGISTTNGTGSIPTFTTPSTITTTKSNIISLQATLNGCTGPSSTFTISANPNPIANFSFPTVCEGNSFMFNDLSTVGSGTINQWGWDMDNNGTYTEITIQNPIYTFLTAGNYTVGLHVTSNKGCKDSTAKSFYVNPSPIVTFSGDTAGCSPFETVLNGTASVDAPQTIQSWTWNLGNGNLSSGTTLPVNSVSAIYTNASHTQNVYYSPSLQAVSNIGCIGKMIRENYIVVYPVPKADFEWIPETADLIDPLINFHNLSEGASGANAYSWNFGDVLLPPSLEPTENYSNYANPTHKYSEDFALTYTVTLAIENNHQCVDTIKKVLIIQPAVTFYIPNAFSPNKDNKNDGFRGTGIGIDTTTYHLWIYDRWGELIFHTTDLEASWDGTYKGNKVQEDTYIWKVDFADVFTKPHQYHGHVTVVR